MTILTGSRHDIDYGMAHINLYSKVLSALHVSYPIKYCSLKIKCDFCDQMK